MRLSLLFAALSLGAAAVPSHAATFCAANATQLQQALASAGSNGLGDEVRIRAGVLSATTASNGWTYDLLITDGQSVDISGGWTDAGCTQRVETASATTLLAAPGSRMLRVYSSTGRPVFSVSNLRISFVTQSNGGCAFEVGGLMDVVLQRLRFNNLECGTLIAGQVNGGTFAVRNSLFADNQSVDALVRLFGVGANAASASVFTQNTLVGNTVSASMFLANIRAEPGDSKAIENNVVWDNTMVPDPQGMLRQFETVEATSASLRNNRLQVLPSAFANASGNSAGDPGFSGAVDYRPRADSPLRDAGIANPAGGTTVRDLSGLPRVQGLRVDIGAFESEAALFAAGFEPTVD